MRNTERYKIFITMFGYRFPLQLFREKSFRMHVYLHSSLFSLIVVGDEYNPHLSPMILSKVYDDRDQT